uniref:MLLE-like domain-containing protein n=2 Tax=Oryza sativa subsp. japonica TaxID=39947 RepID=Q2R956_ORYSJ|nr:hypothetical protein LOC_Os11g09900 [Oryza sativa Japonica Group]ABA91980.1 hypothetical protein LOC_Os11g09900 [Oryza sativa Japonica Group]
MRTRIRMRTRYHWIYLRENSPNLSLSQLFRHLMIGQIFATLLLRGFMEHLGSSCIVRGRGKNKRIWTYFEDEELIKALFEIALDPSWKSEGGFKNGYCQVLENVLAKKLPSSGLTAVPTKFGTIEVMLTKSGFSWDDNRKMIQCEKQQYDDHCRKNNEAKGLYGVAFPHYDTLAAIYGKDIATREGAEGLGEAVANMEKEIVQDIQDEEDKEDEERVSRETPRRSIDLAAPRRSIDSAAPRRSIDSAAPRRSIDSTASSSKKRKKNSNKLKNTLSSDPFMDVFANVQGDPTDVTKHVGAMVASMQREAEIQEKAMAEEDPLQKIQNEAILECQKLGLTGTEVVNAAAAFVKVPAQMSMLIALPESLRREARQRPLGEGSPKGGRATEGCGSRPPALSLLQSGFIKLLVRSTFSDALQGKEASKEGETLILVVLDIWRKRVKTSRDLDRRGNG